jgi:hypothetical protein
MSPTEQQRLLVLITVSVPVPIFPCPTPQWRPQSSCLLLELASQVLKVIFQLVHEPWVRSPRLVKRTGNTVVFARGNRPIIMYHWDRVIADK